MPDAVRLVCRLSCWSRSCSLLRIAHPTQDRRLLSLSLSLSLLTGRESGSLVHPAPHVPCRLQTLQASRLSLAVALSLSLSLDYAVVELVSAGARSVESGSRGAECSRDATVSRASLSAGGMILPLASARRRIPLQARLLKKYFCGTLPSSRISDKEHAPPPLRYGKPLAVQNRP